MSVTKTDLIPPDFAQCQAVITTRPGFMQLGGAVKTARCESRPITLLTQIEPGEDGLRGQMTVCARCLSAYKESMQDAPAVAYTGLPA